MNDYLSYNQRRTFAGSLHRALRTAAKHAHRYNVAPGCDPYNALYTFSR